MKYLVCYPIRHTRTIEFAGIKWTPGESVEFAKLADIPEAIIEDVRFVITETNTATRRRKTAKESIVPEPESTDPPEPDPEG